MKSILSTLIFISLALSSCDTSKEAISNSKSTETRKKAEETPIVGNDLDENGCKNSAGYSWSTIKNDCIRIFEAGSSFNSTNPSEALAAYVILSDDLKRAEVYIPSRKKSILLDRVSLTDKSILFENKGENIEIIQNQTDFIIRLNKANVYIQKSSKEYGLGVKF